jgi:DNA-binding NtrC family response regulator
MAAGREPRKVLVLRDDPSIRNLLALLKHMARDKAWGDEPLLAAINRNQFEAVILDVRCSQMSGEEVRGIKEFRPGFVGKQLVIMAECNGPKTLDLLERYLKNGLPQTLLWLISHRYKSPE